MSVISPFAWPLAPEKKGITRTSVSVGLHRILAILLQLNEMLSTPLNSLPTASYALGMLAKTISTSVRAMEGEIHCIASCANVLLLRFGPYMHPTCLLHFGLFSMYEVFLVSLPRACTCNARRN